MHLLFLTIYWIKCSNMAIWQPGYTSFQREHLLVHCECKMKAMYSLLCFLKLRYGIKTYLLLIGFLRVFWWVEINWSWLYFELPRVSVWLKNSLAHKCWWWVMCEKDWRIGWFSFVARKMCVRRDVCLYLKFEY